LEFFVICDLGYLFCDLGHLFLPATPESKASLVITPTLIHGTCIHMSTMPDLSRLNLRTTSYLCEFTSGSISRGEDFGERQYMETKAKAQIMWIDQTVSVKQSELPVLFGEYFEITRPHGPA
jgi:hypothetical protein